MTLWECWRAKLEHEFWRVTVTVMDTLMHTSHPNPSGGESALTICWWYDSSAAHTLFPFVGLIWNTGFKKKKKMTWAIQRHKRGGRGWWPKRVLWVRDEKEHFALDSNVFVVIPGLPTFLYHDSFPPIHWNQLCFGYLPLSLLSFEKRNCKIRKDFVDRGWRF